MRQCSFEVSVNGGSEEESDFSFSKHGRKVGERERDSEMLISFQKN